MTRALEVSGLTVELARHDPAVTLLADLAFGVQSGHCLGIVGESGCGKSLTLRAVMGLVPPGVRAERDDIRVAGRTVDRAAAPPPGVAMVFQDSAAALDPSMRVGRYLTYVLRRHRGLGRADAHQTAVALLTEVGVPEPHRHLRSFPHQLSGGLRQRTAIALALATDPAVLLCDEPTTALDVTTQARILQLLRERLVERDFGMVFVSHDMGVVRQIADTVAVMYAGRIVETGPVVEVIERSRHPYTRMLLDALPVNASREAGFSSIPGMPPAPGRYVAGCRFADRCPHHEEACDVPRFGLSGLADGHHSDCVHDAAEGGAHARG